MVLWCNQAGSNYWNWTIVNRFHEPDYSNNMTKLNVNYAKRADHWRWLVSLQSFLFGASLHKSPMPINQWQWKSNLNVESTVLNHLLDTHTHTHIYIHTYIHICIYESLKKVSIFFVQKSGSKLHNMQECQTSFPLTPSFLSQHLLGSSQCISKVTESNLPYVDISLKTCLLREVSSYFINFNVLGERSTTSREVKYGALCVKALCRRNPIPSSA